MSSKSPQAGAMAPLSILIKRRNRGYANKQGVNLGNKQVGTQLFDDKPASSSNRGEGLTCEISHKLIDPEWDLFVANVSKGDHRQSSLWAAFKASYGWSPIRIIVKKEGHIVAGAQVLVRRLLGTLKIAHVLQGPVLSSNASVLLETVLDQLVRVVGANKISFLAVLPAYNCGAVDLLRKYGFHASGFLGGERATLIIDLSQESKLLLRQMRRTTRNNIRLGHDRGVRVRVGEERDLNIFHELLKSTSRRHKFTPESRDNCLNLWRHLEPSRHIMLFLAEYRGEVLSGLLAIPFGDTVMMKMFGWSGSKKWLRPNELLVWKAIEWSKEEGFIYFDLDGIHISAALALLSGACLPEPVKSSGTRFKLGFGGSAVLLPATYEYISNRAMRALSRKLFPEHGNRDLSPMLHRVLSERIIRKMR